MVAEVAPHEWVRDQRLDRGLLQVDVEDQTAALGFKVSQSHLSKIEKGRSPLAGLGAEKLDALRRVLGVTPGEWLRGTGLSLVTAETPHNGGTRPLLRGEFIDVPVFRMASATPDGNCSDTSPDTSAAIPAKYARPNCCAYLVEGDSMDAGDDPIRSGDVVICDHTDTDLIDGRIYIVQVLGNGTLLKRVRIFDGVPELQSDNRAYRTLRPEDARVLGRVIYHDPQGRAL